MEMQDCLKITDGNAFVRVTVENSEDNDAWVNVIVHSGDDCVKCSEFLRKNISRYDIMKAVSILFYGFKTTTVIHHRNNVTMEMLFYVENDMDFVMAEIHH
jgi:hypothetical protein